MRIFTAIETPEDFTLRVANLLKAETTHVYFDTSFLMWLTKIGDKARSEFFQWAETLGERTHVPLWSMHEYYRHHTAGTLKAELSSRVDQLLTAAKSFQTEIRKYADQPFFVGQSEAAYQDAVDKAVDNLKELGDAAKNWEYEHCATGVIEWMNSRPCLSGTIFRSMSSLGEEGTARYTQDIPPGFLDRWKEDTTAKGSNKYGDLLFWQEIVQHAPTVQAKTVMVVTRDRKQDWFAATGEPAVDLVWKRIRARWLPVPRAHPTLAFELQIEAGAELVLLDELYLGALLWKFGRPSFERLASTAIAVPQDHFQHADPPPRQISVRARKRHEQATIGLAGAVRLLAAASGPPDERVATLLSHLDQDAPVVDEFLERLGADTLAPLSNDEAANFARLLHDRAKPGFSPATAAARKLLNLLDSLPADTAAAVFAGFLCSAYLIGERPLGKPESPFLEDIFAWQADTAVSVVLQAFNFKMRQLRSAALYFPDGKTEKIAMRMEHDSDQPQDPAALSQVYFKGRALLGENEFRPDAQLRTVIGSSTATITEIARALSRHYGLPFELLDLQNAHAEDLRLIPEVSGLLEFSRFDRLPISVEALAEPEDVVGDNEDEGDNDNNGDSDASIEED